MIISLRFSNFYSFAESTTIDFSVGKNPKPSDFDINIEGLRLNKVISVIGANGSGKTQYIKVIAFLKWFMTSSLLGIEPDDLLPYSAHKLHLLEDSNFELEFIKSGVTYKYQLTLNAGQVISEALYKKTSSQYSYIFKRERNSDSTDLHSADNQAEHYHFKQKGFAFPKNKAQSLRSNTSLIAAAYSYDVKEAQSFIEYFQKISTNVASSGRHHFQHESLFKAAAIYEEKPDLKKKMIELMCRFDLGLSNVSIEQVEAADVNGKNQKRFIPVGHHAADNGGEFSLSFLEESSGTQSSFVLIEKLLMVLEFGGIAVIDEIDNDLHPHLIPELIERFRFEHTNPHQAQLIFNCHSAEILNRLQKHQVYLCEKQTLCSEAWRLDEMTGLRADDNLYAKYMAGALGAVPDIS